MAERKQVQGIDNGAPVRPTAAPVSTYIRPEMVQKTGLASLLAESLKGVSPIIDDYAVRKIKEGRAHVTAEAQQAAIKGEAKSYADAVKRNEIDRTQSPLFKKVYDYQKGRYRAFNYQVALNAAYQEWATTGEGNEDEADLNSFINNFREDYLGEETLDTSFVDGFSEVSAGAEANLVSQHVAFDRKRKVVRQKEALSQNIVSAVEAYSAGLMDEGMLYEVMTDIPSFQVLYSVLDGKEVNETVVDAIVTVAEKHGRSDLLHMAERRRKDGTPGPGTTQYGREKIQDAITRIENKTIRDFNFARTVDAAKAEETDKELLTEAASTLVEDPTADLTDLYSTIGKHNPKLITLVDGMRSSLQTPLDTERYGGLLVSVMKGEVTSPADIVETALEAGAPFDKINTLLSFARSGTSKGVDSRYTFLPGMRRNLQKAIAGNDGEQTTHGILLYSQAELEQAEALATYLESTPEATPMDVRKHMTDINAELVVKYAASPLEASARTDERINLPESLKHLSDYTKSPFFGDATRFSRLIEEFEADQTQGRIVREARILGISPEELIRAQKAIYDGQETNSGTDTKQ